MTAPLRKPRATKSQQRAATQARKELPDRMLLPALVKERNQLYEDRLRALRAAPKLKTPDRITNGTAPSNLSYDPRKDMLAPPVRKGATDHEKHPSRQNNVLIYRDGRRVDAW